MAQKQGPSSTHGGRLDGSIGTAPVAGDFVLGAGWGGTASLTVTAGSTDQRGQIVITASATTPAQATATVTFTFKDGAYASAPWPLVLLADNTQAVAETGATDIAATTTALSWTHSVLPVAAKVYTYNYCLIA